MALDPVAWRVIEQGWSVLDAAGNEIGDGGAVLTRAKYVPSEHVAQILRGEITLDLSPEDAAKLEPYAEQVSEPLANLEPKAEEARSASMSWSQRLGNKLLGRRP